MEKMTNASELSFANDLVAGNVKAAMREAGAASSDLWKVPRDQIRILDGFNVRSTDDPDYRAHIRSIADSIKENGFYQDKPLSGFVGKDGKADVIFLTDGHSRLAAVDIAVSEGAEITVLPVVIKPRGTSMEDLTVALYTSNTGRPLTPFETGVICKRLVGYGWEPREIAKRLGLTSKYVNDLLGLVGAPKAVRELVTTGLVSATTAIKTIRDYGATASQTLNDAVTQAKASGKNRVTAKNLTPPKRRHPDDEAVDQFAKAMKAKMAASRAKGRGGWDDLDACGSEDLCRMLVEHVAKGDPVDVANFAMMLHARGEAIVLPDDQDDLAGARIGELRAENEELTKIVAAQAETINALQATTTGNDHE